jgi:hypothetical protein
MAALEIVWRNPEEVQQRHWRLKKGVMPGIYVIEVFFPEKNRWASLYVLTMEKPVPAGKQAEAPQESGGLLRNWRRKSAAAVAME